MRPDCEVCRGFEQEHQAIARALLKLENTLRIADLEQNRVRAAACREAIEAAEEMLADFRATIHRHVALMHVDVDVEVKAPFAGPVWAVPGAFRS